MKKIKIFYNENCPYCEKLINSLNELKIDFEGINIETNIGYKKYLKLRNFTNNDGIPCAIVGNQVIIPDVSYKTIDEAITLIKSLSEDS